MKSVLLSGPLKTKLIIIIINYDNHGKKAYVQLVILKSLEI